MILGVLFSGGKDSLYATYLASKNEKIGCLITIESENKESYMFHTPNIHLTKIQAKALNLPLITVKTKGKKEAELNDLKKAIKLAIKKHKIQGIVTGTLTSIYQSSRIQKICNDLKIYCFNPLWQKNQLELLNELVKNKFKIIITQIAAEGFTKEWLGKKINKETIEKLKVLNKKYGTNLSGDDGGYESLVLDGPLFKTRINIKKYNIITLGKFNGIYNIEAIE